jgi:hypothetical protein
MQSVICEICSTRFTGAEKKCQKCGSKRVDYGLVCKACGSLTNGKSRMKGSFRIEVTLVVLCIIAFVFVSYLVGFLFLAATIFYSLWRVSTKHKACTACGSDQLIPVDSPIGAQIIKEAQNTTRASA